MQGVETVKLTPSKMRAMLAKSMDKLRTLRRGCITEGKMGFGKEEYAREVVIAASFIDSLMNEERIGSVKNALIGKYNSDAVLSGYDSTQRNWWSEQEDGAVFVRTLHALTAYCLRGSACGPEDTAHVLQVMKQLHESEENRSDGSFILPAYGGVGIGPEHLGPLLVSMTGNRHLVPRSGGMALDLDWYPDDLAQGVAETAAVLEAAGKLGFYRIMFQMPPSCIYRELHGRFDVKAVQSGDGFTGIIPCPQEEGKPKTLFQQLEIGDKKLSEVPDSGFARAEDLVLSKRGSVTVAACTDSVGFAERVLFSAADGELSASGGVYYDAAVSGGKKPGPGVLESITLHFCGKRMLGDDSFSIGGIGGMLEEAAEKGGPKAILFYGTVKNNRTEEEHDVEGVEEDVG